MTDQAPGLHGLLHVKSTFTAWQELLLGSEEKWLRVHSSHEWPGLNYHKEQSVLDLRRFYDYYLKGINNDCTPITTSYNAQTGHIKLCLWKAQGLDDMDVCDLAKHNPTTNQVLEVN
ncbi:hypothetical protein ASPCADRAFT_1612 [Aspergillus carbonarius ITEM 5010]|uniref:Uncharacterized protein n=1 Tax=Aspergillus carbonarius (strain ITEM 5010) TaxID=602072 RepID=A0A1R3RZS9_ASPC5|nr:hypothetical protein ASPCADRAFT_1612 [Aspergillus carbonarius ITEM 5010]